MFDAFYSDPHFGHANIIEFADRPFRDLTEMHREMLDRYNAVISPRDTVLWLGDVTIGGSVDYIRKYIDKLNGRKVLIKGNHDGSNPKMLRMGFTAVMDYMTLEIADREVLCCHLPFYDPRPNKERRYPKMYHPERKKGLVLLHGHTHDRLKVRGNQIHVGVDAWDWGPALYDDVAELIWRLPGG